MPSKSSRTRSPAQQKNAQEKVRNTASQVEQRKRALKAEQKAASKQRAKEARIRDNELKKLMRTTKTAGIYSPKSDELTRYRKRRLKEIRSEWGEYLNSDKYFFISVPKKISPDQIANLQLEASRRKVANTKKGLFYPKDHHKAASLHYDKKHDEYYIERRGKTKQGVNKGRIYRDHIPLTSFDALTSETERLRRAAKRLPINYDKGERLAFVVEENGVEGASANLYDSIDSLLNDLERYLKSVAARIHFYRHIRLQKTTLKEWNEKHPRRSPGAKGRKKIGKAKRR